MRKRVFDEIDFHYEKMSVEKGRKPNRRTRRAISNLKHAYLDSEAEKADFTKNYVIEK